MTRAAQRARLLTASLADLHERLGRLCAGTDGKINRPEGGKPWEADAERLRDMQIDGYVRRANPLPCHNAELRMAERRAWDASDEAWQRFRQHGDRARYRAEMADLADLLSPERLS